MARANSTPEENTSQMDMTQGKIPEGQFGVHGPENKRDWPALSEEETSAVLERFPLPSPPAALIWHGRRPFSATGIVQLQDKKRVFVKRHDHSLRDATALAEEHRFIDHLATRGLPVGKTWRTRDGQAALDMNRSGYEVFSFMPGHDLYEDVQSWEPFFTPQHAASAGALLGQLHTAARDFSAPARPSRRPLLSTLEVISQPALMTALEHWIHSQNGLSAALSQLPWKANVRDAITPFHERLKPVLSDIIPAWGHGDWHPSNLFWSDTGPDARVTGILDFGMSDRTCAAYDLAVALERCAIGWLHPERDCPVHHDRVAAFLRGYGERRTLSARERRLVTLFLPLVHVEYALSEVAYYSALVHDARGVKAAYSDYLLGHAAWFASPTGRTFLAWLDDTLGVTACP